MKVTYDRSSGAAYILLGAKSRVARTVEYDADTYLDLDGKGEVLGVELLRPCRAILRKISRSLRRPELLKLSF